MIPYRVPQLCARCGKPDVATAWKVGQKPASFNLRSALTEWVSIYVLRHPPSTFDVPVCGACAHSLGRVRRITRQVTLSLAIFLGLLFAIMYIAAAVKGDHLVSELIVLLLITLVGALFGALIGFIFSLVMKEVSYYDFCGFDGEYFQFKNKDFRRAFAAYNPTLVKRKK
jgi:hypothetical protein